MWSFDLGVNYWMKCELFGPQRNECNNVPITLNNLPLPESFNLEH